eukprot:scaffold129989_cov63-Phaeocystis_antarctica.AAC.7
MRIACCGCSLTHGPPDLVRAGASLRLPGRTCRQHTERVMRVRRACISADGYRHSSTHPPRLPSPEQP